ncbi:MAG: AlwI family type II restriction endonuclease [Arcobacteraceae bacterium]
MKKIWSMATAVRNPERLRNFLTTLKEIEGKVWNSQLQEEFQARLVKNRFYGYSNGQFYSTLSQATVQLIENLNHHISLTEAFNILREKNYPEGFAIRGRTSYKPLEKVGLAFIQNGKIKISSLGNYLLGDNYDIGKIFFRSFIKWQYPNPESRDFSDRSIYNIKPFIATLHLINEVNKICEQRNLKVKGISKQEFMIFGQSLLHYQDISSQAERLVGFRVTLDSLQSSDEKKEYIGNYITDFLSEFDNATDGNLHDYADNTIRYFRLTRYITVRGGGFYIDLEPRRMIEIQKLLDTDDASAKEFTRDDYITYMSDINQPILPWEEKNELLKIYHSTLDDIRNLEVQMSIATYTFSLENEEIEYLKSEIEKLREYRHKLQNVELKQQLQDVSQIDEVIDKLTNIRSQDLKPSIALEKYITHALNIINDAKEIKANSILSDDNDFIFTAPANKPDIECFYESFNSVCEVTMLTNRDQWHNEGQPVMRHFRDFESASSHQDNYCLFVAPAMHRDTINTFWYSVKFGYEGETDDKKQKIVPLSISQIIQILQTIKELKLQNKSFSHLKFKQFLDGIIGLKNTVTSSDEWLRAIPTILNNFKQELLCS